VGGDAVFRFCCGLGRCGSEVVIDRRVLSGTGWLVRCGGKQILGCEAGDG
jgi:hypothetical protein